MLSTAQIVPLAGVQGYSSVEAAAHSTAHQGALVSISGEATMRVGIWPLVAHGAGFVIPPDGEAMLTSSTSRNK